MRFYKSSLRRGKGGGEIGAGWVSNESFTRETQGPERKFLGFLCDSASCGELVLHRSDDFIRKFFRSGFSAYILGQLVAVAIDLVDRIADFERGVMLADVAQHEQR